MAKVREKKQEGGLFCFSCLGKGRPPSLLITDEITFIQNTKDKENEISNIPENPSQPNGQYPNEPENDNNITNEPIYNEIDNQANNNENDMTTNSTPKRQDSATLDSQTTMNEKQDSAASPVTTADTTTSPSHLSLSQVPTTTISSQYSTYRFPSTGLSSPQPPLKCGFLVR